MTEPSASISVIFLNQPTIKIRSAERSICPIAALNIIIKYSGAAEY